MSNFKTDIKKVEEKSTMSSTTKTIASTGTPVVEKLEPVIHSDMSIVGESSPNQRKISSAINNNNQATTLGTKLAENTIEFVNKEIEKMYIKETPSIEKADIKDIEERKLHVIKDQKEFEIRRKTMVDHAFRLRIELEKTKKDIENHRQLLLEAQSLEKKSATLAEELKKKELEKTRLREEALELERQFEVKRAEQHSKAVLEENERAKAAAEKTVHEKESDYAKTLITKHVKGIEHSEALSKKLEFEVQEAELAAKRLEFERNNAEILLLGNEMEKPESMEIEVGVKPIHLQEQRVDSSILAPAPQNVIATSTVKESFERVEEKIPVITENLIESEKISMKTSHAETEVSSKKKSKSKQNEQKTV